MTLRSSVARALETEPPAERDQAVADLALVYAEQIDRGEDLTKLGPSLLAALEALQMSPRARALARTKGAPSGSRTGRLDELRAARARKSNPANLDTTAS